MSPFIGNNNFCNLVGISKLSPEIETSITIPSFLPQIFQMYLGLRMESASSSCIETLIIRTYSIFVTRGSIASGFIIHALIRRKVY
jgi:hypothetical protein